MPNRVRGGLRWVLTGSLAAAALTAATTGTAPSSALVDGSADTTTPIKHLVVIFDENVSFDHYFATYPYAANTDGTPFRPVSDTPTKIDTLMRAGLIPGTQLPAHNPNADLDHSDVAYSAPNLNTYQPQRLAQSQAVTCDQNHGYGPEQKAMSFSKTNSVAAVGAMANFVATTGVSTCATTQGAFADPSLVMDYYDGNTVTALWNYAQHYAMSDNSWDAVFGPSTPGALNLISGNTYSGTQLVNSDIDPSGDAFGTNPTASPGTMKGTNVGDLLNAKGVSWGWFQGGFASKTASTVNVAGAAALDYSAHHAPFQYYASTSNGSHARPASGAEVGHDGAANHQYDLSDFDAALSGTAINGSVPDLPAVSYLKAPQAQDGHAGYSDPLDEQAFLTKEINAIQQSSYWPSTAVVVAYDDSDGWYDHVAPTITNSSAEAAGDTLICTKAADNGVPALAGYQGRCGPSQRLPLLVISPYAKQNYVSHRLTTQVSVLKFIEDNWSTGTIDETSAVPGSFDASANGLDDMFDFSHPQPGQVLLDSTMYRAGSGCPGSVTCEGKINPTFGAVTSTPLDTTPPLPAPIVDVTTNDVTYPEGASLPSPEEFLAKVGATINAGTLTLPDLSGIDPETVGVYPVKVGGVAAGIKATAPQVVRVSIAPIVSVAHSTITVPTGTSITPSYLRTAVGASITSGVLDLPSLAGVDLGTPGSYPVQITGTANGVQAIPATVTLVVQGGSSGGGGRAPTISLQHRTLAYAVGDAPSPADVAAAAGATISSGSLAPIDLAGVDFGAPGTTTVRVTGSDGDLRASPVSLTIVVKARPTISTRGTTLTTRVGTRLTSDQVLAETFAAIDHGVLLPVDLAGVDFSAPASYDVLIQGADSGLAARPVAVMIEVVAAPATPTAPVAAPAFTVTGPKRIAQGARATLRLHLTRAVSGATATAYQGSRRLAGKHVSGTTAKLRLPRLDAGTHHIRVRVTAGGRSVTRKLTIRVVAKSRRK
jgi:phospholipase C